MILDFAWLPPEVNSALIYSGAGSAPLHVAAAAWEGLGADLASSASSFDSVIVGLASGPWAGPASASMAAAATPYVGWLSAAATQAQIAAGQARAAASAFEAALTGTVHPAAVSSNRVSLMTLVATNFLGLNTPAIASTEFDYVEMWAQDVAAMVGYHGGATAVAASLSPFSLPPVDLAGLAANVGSQFTGLATSASSAMSPLLSGVTAGAPALVASVQSAASALPISSISSVAQIVATPASMVMGPLMQLGQGAGASTAGLASATEGLADPAKFVGDVSPMKGLGGGAGMGGGMAAGLGNAHLVGAMSTPPTWQGSMPKGMASSAMSGVGMNAAEMAAAAGATGGAAGGGMPMMPMPMGGGGGAGAGMPGGMGRGGGNPHVQQNRPSVIPRSGVG